MGHAEAYNNGTQAGSRKSDGSTNYEESEKSSLAAENAIRKEHNLPLRPKY